MTYRDYGSADDVRREARSRTDNRANAGGNPFWDLVNLAEKVRLPKPHLTQPDIVAQIETAMGEFDEAGRASAFRQVLTGVVEGRFSQYSVLPFGHFAASSFKDDNGKDQTRNRAPEARRLMTVIDAIIEEMPEDSGYRKRNASYSEAVNSVRDEETGEVDDGQLSQLIIEADKAGELFWTDSTEFIEDGNVVEGSAMTLVDLAVAGVISVQETENGGSKAFIAGGKYLPPAIDKLAEAGFEDAAELLRSRTQRRKQSASKLGSGLSALTGLGPKTEDEATTNDETTIETSDDGFQPSEGLKAKAKELKAQISGSETATEAVDTTEEVEVAEES